MTIAPLDHTPGCPCNPKDSDKPLNMDTIVELIRRKGVWAEVQGDGGNIATIFAGAQLPGPDKAPIYAAIAGPGVLGKGQEPSMASTGDFRVHADDDSETHAVECAKVGATTEQTIADLIIAQALLPFGASLSDAAAQRILKSAAIERLGRAAAELVASL